VFLPQTKGLQSAGAHARRRADPEASASDGVGAIPDASTFDDVGGVDAGDDAPAASDRKG